VNDAGEVCMWTGGRGAAAVVVGYGGDGPVACGQAAAAADVYEGGQIDGRHWRW